MVRLSASPSHPLVCEGGDGLAQPFNRPLLRAPMDHVVIRRTPVLDQHLDHRTHNDTWHLYAHHRSVMAPAIPHGISMGSSNKINMFPLPMIHATWTEHVGG